MQKFKVKLSKVDVAYKLNKKQISTNDGCRLLQSTEIDFTIGVVESEDSVNNKTFYSHIFFPFLVLVNVNTKHDFCLEFTDPLPKNCIPETNLQLNLNELLKSRLLTPQQLLEYVIGEILGPLVQVTIQADHLLGVEIELNISEKYQTAVSITDHEIANFLVFDPLP